MEVMQHRTEEVEVMEEPLLVERRKHLDNINGFHSDRHVVIKNRNISENSVYVDNNGENLKAEGLDIPKLVNAVINNQSAGNDLEEIVASGLNASTFGQTSWDVENISESVGATEKVRIGIVEESEDDVIELEFERAVEKVHTHTAHCPNCNKQITKVVLRRRKRESSGDSKPGTDKPLDLFGCLSCFSIFVPSGNSLNPFRMFGDKEKVEVKKGLGSNLPASPGSTSGKGNSIVKPGNAIDLLGIFWKRGDRKPSLKPEGGDDVEEPAGNAASNASQEPGTFVKIDIRPGASPGSETTVEPGTDELNVNSGKPAEISNADGIKSLEILKCIVYGGLLESITSLSVVSSAAASDAKTLSIIALGLANVIGGLFVIAKNLVDLKNEDSGGSPNQETHRYQELLGRRRHFSLHATLAILSFLVFGLIPPVVYGFTFRVSDNKDHKILAVAASSLASIIILATAKTYTKRPEKFNAYIKTVLYYCTMAFAVSGVSYAAGDLIKILMERLDWFEPSPGSGAASSFISNMNPATPAWAYY